MTSKAPSQATLDAAMTAIRVQPIKSQFPTACARIKSAAETSPAHLASEASKLIQTLAREESPEYDAAIAALSALVRDIVA